MTAGDVDAEHVDRVRADRTDDLVGLVGEGVQGPAEPVVVEQVGVDVVDLLHRPRMRPVGHGDHRFRAGQLVGDQRLDDLSVAGQRNITHRAGPVHDTRDVQPGGEVRDHR